MQSLYLRRIYRLDAGAVRGAQCLDGTGQQTGCFLQRVDSSLAVSQCKSFRQLRRRSCCIRDVVGGGETQPSALNLRSHLPPFGTKFQVGEKMSRTSGCRAPVQGGVSEPSSETRRARSLLIPAPPLLPDPIRERRFQSRAKRFEQFGFQPERLVSGELQVVRRAATLRLLARG